MKLINNSFMQSLSVLKKIFIFIITLLLFSSCFNKNFNSNIIENKNMEIKDFAENFFAQINVKDFKKEMEDDEVILLDVRTSWELVEYGKLRENQILIDINEDNFVSEISKLDKTKKYLIYCWHGNRSVIARDYMKWQWFTYAKDLAWWIDTWIYEGESVLK